VEAASARARGRESGAGCVRERKKERKKEREKKMMKKIFHFSFSLVDFVVFVCRREAEQLRQRLAAVGTGGGERNAQGEVITGAAALKQQQSEKKAARNEKRNLEKFLQIFPFFRFLLICLFVCLFVCVAASASSSVATTTHVGGKQGEVGGFLGRGCDISPC
jgi:hypothetical protein